MMNIIIYYNNNIIYTTGATPSFDDKRVGCAGGRGEGRLENQHTRTYRIIRSCTYHNDNFWRAYTSHTHFTLYICAPGDIWPRVFVFAHCHERIAQ